MHYVLSPNAESHYINVTAHLANVAAEMVELQLPAWRPGRYELQDFAKNIRQFHVTDGAGQPLRCQKITKDRWRVETGGATDVVAHYDYYALLSTPHQLNAGSSYAGDNLLYVNPVNLCVYAEGRIEEPCTLTLDVLADWTVACGLPQKTATAPADRLFAQDFYELIDSPLLAGPGLQRIDYTVANVAFSVWVAGARPFDADRVRQDFTRFTEAQIALFGTFPEGHYHFLTVALPVAYYHGVEHRHSTVLVLGPDTEGEGLYQDLLGIASHELFHAWNIIRIRPAELLPYDLTRENYFNTCFVAEGVTTYYGDLMLRRAGVFSDAAYFKEFHVLLKRHFEASGRAAQSLLESSWDLWLDGYEKGVPGRKVSVYHKGALVALMLDLHLRRKFAHQRSLDDVMRRMWQQFGEPFVGYTLADYVAICEEVAEESLNWYFTTCIAGNVPLENLLNKYLSWVGLQMRYSDDEADGPVGSVLLDDLGSPDALAERKRWLSAGTTF